MHNVSLFAQETRRRYMLQIIPFSLRSIDTVIDFMLFYKYIYTSAVDAVWSVLNMLRFQGMRAKHGLIIKCEMKMNYWACVTPSVLSILPPQTKRVMIPDISALAPLAFFRAQRMELTGRAQIITLVQSGKLSPELSQHWPPPHTHSLIHTFLFYSQILCISKLLHPNRTVGRLPVSVILLSVKLLTCWQHI